MVENNVNMDKFLKCAVIKYLFLKGMSGKAIHDDMLITLGDSAPIYSVVKSWLRVQTREKQCRGWASFRTPQRCSKYQKRSNC